MERKIQRKTTTSRFQRWVVRKRPQRRQSRVAASNDHRPVLSKRKRIPTICSCCAGRVWWRRRTHQRRRPLSQSDESAATDVTDPSKTMCNSTPKFTTVQVFRQRLRMEARNTKEISLVSFHFITSPFSKLISISIFTAVTTIKNQKSFVVDRNNQFESAPKVEIPPAPWDMDFKGHWEMERDLISEFKNHPKDTKQVEDDDEMMLKLNLTRIMEDDVIGDKIVVKATEAQSISSLTSKFDENVKALWDDVDEPATHKSFDDGGSNANRHLHNRPQYQSPDQPNHTIWHPYLHPRRGGQSVRGAMARWVGDHGFLWWLCPLNAL